MRWPNCFIVGAAKAGTTSLYAYLNEHPDICMSRVKEPHYFSNVVATSQRRASLPPIVKDESTYLALFDNPHARIWGEASPSYLWDTQTAKRLEQVSPDARIVIMLRHPVERAYSHYLMDVRNGVQTLPFFEALKEDSQATKRGWGVSHMYLELGCYTKQVKAYLETFQRTQIHIIFYENFSKDTLNTASRCLNFLGVDPFLKLEPLAQAHNSFATPRNELAQRLLNAQGLRALSSKLLPARLRKRISSSLITRDRAKPTMDERSKRYLQGYYQQDITDLATMTEKTLPWKSDS